MNLYRSLTQSRATLDLTLDEWANYFTYNGLQYPFIRGGTPSGETETVAETFEGYVQGVYKRSGVVFAVMLARMLLFSEARFQFRRIQNGTPGELFGTQALEPLERPWKRATTRDLLNRMIQDVDLGGNSFTARRGTNRDRRLKRMRPDWTTIVLGSPNADLEALASGNDLDAEVIGYLYEEGGPGGGREPEFLEADSVAHWAPIPDPVAAYRGMSWLQPIIREILGDSAATEHKLRFFDSGATPAYVVKLDIKDPIKLEEFIKRFRKEHSKLENAYKTIFFGAGADITTVGADLKQLDFKIVQGGGETRIAAAGGVPPIIVGLSEGLAYATYSNYGQARRRFADGTMQPLWGSVAGALSSIVDVPARAELAVDGRNISFLQEDMKDNAEIQSLQAAAIRQLVDAGYTAESVIDAINSNDLTRLRHSGLFSVQLHPAGATAPPSNATEEGA